MKMDHWNKKMGNFGMGTHIQTRSLSLPQPFEAILKKHQLHGPFTGSIQEMAHPGNGPSRKWPIPNCNRGPKKSQKIRMMNLTLDARIFSTNRFYFLFPWSIIRKCSSKKFLHSKSSFKSYYQGSPD